MITMRNYINNLTSLVIDVGYFVVPVLAITSLILVLGGTVKSIIVLIALFLFTVLPGFLIIRLLVTKPQEYLFTWLVSLPLTIAMLIYPSLLSYYLRTELGLMVCFVSSLPIILVVLNILFKESRIFSGSKKFNTVQLVIWFLFFVYLYIALRRGSHEAGDAVFHIAYIKNLLVSPRVNPFEAHFPIEAINPSAGYGAWYLILATIAKITNANAFVVWRTTIYLYAPLIPLGIYYFSLAIIKNKTGAMWASFFSALYYFKIGSLTDAVTVNYPDRIGRLIMVPVIVYLFSMLIKNEDDIGLSRKKLLFITAILLTASFSIHMFSWLFSLIILGVMVLAELFFRKKIQLKLLANLFWTWAISLILLLPALLLKIDAIKNYSINVGTKVSANYVSDVIRIGKYFIMVKPHYLVQDLIIVSIATLLLVSFVYFRKPKSYWYYYSWLILIVPLGLMVFPPAATIIAKLFSQVYLLRFILFMPIFIVLGALASNYFSKDVFKIVFVITFIWMLAHNRMSINFTPHNIMSIDGMYQYIDKEIPKRSVIASNLWDSYYLSAYSGDYVVSVYKQHMSSLVNRDERIEDTKYILDVGTSDTETTTLLDKYNVNYIVVRKKLPPKRGITRYFKSNSALFSESNANKFSGDSRYDKIFEDDTYVMYAVNGRSD